jgi:hypothetical protein
MVSINSYPDIDEEIIRYMVLRSIGSYRRKFLKDYGEMIICCDSKPSWRKGVYPYYKANREKSIKSSPLDWKKIGHCIDVIINEIDEYFPYRVVRYKNCEGDDVIATLVMENSLEVINNSNKILIVSADTDHVQLQKYPNVEQYDPIFTKRKIVEREPYKFLKEHIIRGDTGDGVPNILSSDDCLVMGVRQKSIYATKISGWIEEEDITNFCDATMLRNYKRNEMLIDLSLIPQELKNGILESYKSQAGKSKKNIVPYFMKYKLSKLFREIGDY